MRENPLTFDMLTSQLADLKLIQAAAIPMILLVLAEWLISYIKKKDYYDGLDTISATFIGVVNVIQSAALKFATFGIILFFYNMVPWSVPTTWWGFVLCLVAIDACRYWSHRVAHTNRFWWATHVTHHNSEKYNWSVAFRLGWTQHIKIIFFIPVALMGFDPVTFFICHQIEVLYQFWIHTEYIKKLPAPIEYVFVTPSHHRVHHARNEKYLDKNYGSTLVIWDRMFGTFQAEEERPDYGITVPVNSYNPIWLNFHEWVAIFKDVRKSRSMKEAWAMINARPSELERVKTEFNQLYTPISNGEMLNGSSINGDLHNGSSTNGVSAPKHKVTEEV